MTAPLTAADNQAQIENLSFRTQAFINGQYVSAASGKTFDCISPLNGQSITSIAACDTEDINRAVSAARTAFERGTWSLMPPVERKATANRCARTQAAILLSPPFLTVSQMT